MIRQALIAGGGIGGLAAALACVRGGWEVRLFERAAAFSEVGAGIQLGPNVTRALIGWDLAGALRDLAAFPSQLQVRDALRGHELGALALGDTIARRYGAPYATIHRADLHQMLLAQLCRHGGAKLRLGHSVEQFTQTADAIVVRARRTGVAGAQGDDAEIEGDALVGADGLWSTVRRGLLGDAAPRVTGHLAYRALVPQVSLPARLRSTQIMVWLGPRLHLVQYPVRRGEWLNLVGVVHAGRGVARVLADPQNWDNVTDGAGLRAVLAGNCAALVDLTHAVGGWRLWVLCDRSPVADAGELARGRTALLGDAAHPMRPYLAQGAGMAIEDAVELGRALQQALDPAFDVATMLARYAQSRWQRVARVQRRSARNGWIFHAEGPLRWGRDAALRAIGTRLLDQPWLYADA